MINALFDPQVFLSSDHVWDCPKSRNVFLDQLDKHLEFIDSLGDAYILWCDEFDARLWSHPQLPPWKKSREWDIRLSQILYRNLTKHRKRIDISQLVQGECHPPVHCSCLIAHDIFLRLVTAVFRNALTPHFCPSNDNITNEDHRFRAAPTDPWSQFQEVRGPEDWPKKIVATQMFWPISKNNGGRFRKCIELVALSKDIALGQLQRFSFTHRFIEDLLPASRKNRIAEIIVHRLTLSMQEAARDPQLQDEQLASGERRFRVTPRPSSLRIHYEFLNGELVFQRFYDEGHHDDGL